MRIRRRRKGPFERIAELRIQLTTLREENEKIEKQALELHKAGSDMYELYENLKEDLRFCRDTAQEVPEISRANRVGKALSSIYERCVTALSDQEKGKE